MLLCPKFLLRSHTVSSTPPDGLHSIQLSHYSLRVRNFKNSGMADILLFLIKAVPLLSSTEYEVRTYQTNKIQFLIILR